MPELAGWLSTRTLPRGGAVATQVTVTGQSPAFEPRIVLLIHGFATDLRGAEERYQTLLDQLVRSGVHPTRLRHVYGVAWPGDAGRLGVDQVSYPVQIDRAHRSAQRLHKHLTRHRSAAGPQQIVIIAHSLGCRLSLELLRLFDQNPNPAQPRIRSAVYMAAAVPDEFCLAGSQYGPPATDRHELVLFSLRDRVLHLSFPLGQAWETRGRLATAVGRRGGPGLRWSRTRDTRLGHGKYYKHPSAVEEIATALGTTRVRNVATRDLPISVPVARRISSIASTALRRSPRRRP